MASAKKTKSKSLLREYAWCLLMALALALVIRSSAVQAYEVPTGSMKPTIVEGDQLLVSKFAYDLRVPLTGQVIAPLSDPKRGQVIVFANPDGEGPDFVKRIIALPGETLSIVNRILYIDGKPLDDRWGRYNGSTPRTGDNFGPITVPKDCYFVMGDNRHNSYDSRFWNQGQGGFVPREEIRGRAILIHWSWKEFPYKVRWARLGNMFE